MTRVASERTTLITAWETPESCPYCMEHLALDWSFCPNCGRATEWTEAKNSEEGDDEK